MANIKLMKTKAGKGFKLVVNGEWFYTSLGEVYKMLGNKANAANFRGMNEIPTEAQTSVTAFFGGQDEN